MIAIACAFDWLLLLVQGDAALAQVRKSHERLSSAQQQAQGTKLNDSTLIMAAGRPGSGYLSIAHDLVVAVGADRGVRLTPLAGNGGQDNLQDLLLLRGVDLAIVPANVLTHARATGIFGGDLPKRISYVSRLYGQEVHVLAGRDINGVHDLRSRKVAVPLDDRLAQFTADDIFRRLGVPLETSAMETGEALQELRAGVLAAMLVVGSKPLAVVEGQPRDGSIKLLRLPFSTALEEAYSPAILQAEDYPGLVPEGSLVETLSVSAVLMAHTKTGNEESARRVAKAVPFLLSAVSSLAVSHRDPKWKEVNLAAVLSGWSRARAAEAWLSSALSQQRGVLQAHFEEFLQITRPSGAPDLSPAQRQELFRDFQNWARKSVSP